MIKKPDNVARMHHGATSLLSSLRSEVENFDAERDWMIEGVIEGNPIVLVIGPEKAGKSWLLQDLIVSVVSGDSFLGRFPVRKPGPALYLDAEYGPRECARRMIRLARGHGRDALDLVDDLHYNHARGWVIRYARGDGEKKEGGQTTQLASELGAMYRAGEGPSIIVVDPLRNFLGGSENDADAVLEFFLGLDVLRTAAQCPVVVAHHLNKSGGYSGSRALLGRADLIIEGSDEREPWFSCTGRTIRRGDAIAERFTASIEHVDDEDDAKAKTLVRARFASENRSKADLGKTALRVLDVMKKQARALSQRQVGRLAKIANGLAGECLRELENANLVRQETDGWEVTLAEVLA